VKVLHRRVKLALLASLIGVIFGSISAYADITPTADTPPTAAVDGACNGGEIRTKCGAYLDAEGGGQEACESCEEDDCSHYCGSSGRDYEGCIGSSPCK
jgi:hypothetical protein